MIGALLLQHALASGWWFGSVLQNKKMLGDLVLHVQGSEVKKAKKIKKKEKENFLSPV